MRRPVTTAICYDVGETGAQWIRNLLFKYITDPLRATGIF